MIKKFYAHGKLLLSGEYFVLKGAKALAMPCRFGQSLSWHSTTDTTLHWRSTDHTGSLWFEATYDQKLKVLKSTDENKAVFLQRLLYHASLISTLDFPFGEVETELEFPNDWGLGSSSTLTYLIAQLFDVNPFELLFSTQNGSGYDIACAKADSPIIYQLLNQKPHWQMISLPSVFEECFFVHLNKKQLSSPEVNRFKKQSSKPEIISEINAITQGFLECKSREEFQKLISRHEAILADALGRPPVQQDLFPDFKGAIKSLGAWGGDFVMVHGQNVKNYFYSKDYHQILSFEEMSFQK